MIFCLLFQKTIRHEVKIPLMTLKYLKSLQCLQMYKYVPKNNYVLFVSYSIMFKGESQMSHISYTFSSLMVIL